MKKIAVIIYGPPGSGKGTQANLIADKLGLIQFDTGQFIESIVHDPARQREKAVKRERKFYDNGILCTPRWVLKEVGRGVKKISAAGLGVVLSGSPRTLYEAKGLTPLLEKLYGRKKVFVFVLKVPPAGSFKRNKSRFICSICKSPLLMQYYPSKSPKYCPICAGPLYRRTDDKTEIIKVRLNEYRNRTEPIFEFMKKRGYKVVSVNGRPSPYKVFRKINAYLKNRLGN